VLAHVDCTLLPLIIIPSNDRRLQVCSSRVGKWVCPTDYTLSARSPHPSRYAVLAADRAGASDSASELPYSASARVGAAAGAGTAVATVAAAEPCPYTLVVMGGHLLETALGPAPDGRSVETWHQVLATAAPQASAGSEKADAAGASSGAGGVSAASETIAEEEEEDRVSFVLRLLPQRCADLNLAHASHVARGGVPRPATCFGTDSHSAGADAASLAVGASASS